MSETQERDQGVQNDFFNELRKNRTRISIFLTNGRRLAGRIKSFDRFAIVLDAGGGAEEMIFKHAIATISVAVHRPGGFEGAGSYRSPRLPGGETKPTGAEPRPGPAAGTQGTTAAATVPAAGTPSSAAPSIVAAAGAQGKLAPAPTQAAAPQAGGGAGTDGAPDSRRDAE